MNLVELQLVFKNHFRKFQNDHIRRTQMRNLESGINKKMGSLELVEEKKKSSYFEAFINCKEVIVFKTEMILMVETEN